MSLEILLSESENDNDIFELCDLVRETSFSIHNFTGPVTSKMSMKTRLLTG